MFFSWLDEFFARFLSSPTQPRSAHGSTKTIQAPQPAPIAPKPQFANNGPVSASFMHVPRFGLISP